MSPQFEYAIKGTTAQLTAAQYRIDELEVEVVNVWNNALVGDLAVPADQRRTFLLAPTVNKNAPLLPAGLLGPVSLRAARVAILGGDL